MNETDMSAEATSELTSLGLPLQRTGDTEWAIDLSRLRLFKGLSVVARMIGDEILEQCRAGQTDIVLRQKIIPEITPELAALGLTHVMIFALSGVLKGLPHFQEEFHNQIRTVFGTLQRPRWGSVLFPEPEGPVIARASPRLSSRFTPARIGSDSAAMENVLVNSRTMSWSLELFMLVPDKQTIQRDRSYLQFSFESTPGFQSISSDSRE